MKFLKTSFVILFVVSCSIAEAQNHFFGPKLGPNISNIGGDANVLSAKAGVHFGGFLCFISKNDKWAIQPEILFSTQGASFEGNSGAGFRYNYLNIPLLLKYYLEKAKVQVYVGSQLGFLLRGFLDTGSGTEDIKDQLRPLDLSLVLGVGYEFEEIMINLRYNYGLTSTNKNGDQGSFPLRVFQVSFGIKLY